MTNHEAHNPNSYDGNLLFYKTGLLGCTPYDLMESLANEYEDSPGELVSALQIRGEIFGLEGAVSSTQIKYEIERRASLLLGDCDVMVDSLYNSPKTRGNIQGVAKRAGAATIALQVYVSQDLARERVDEWIETAQHPMPLELWGKDHPSKVLQKMNYAAVQPDEADYVLKLDGRHGTDDILDEIHDQLSRNGLA